MKAETIDDLVNWTRDTHAKLAARLEQSASQQSQSRSALLMRYLAEHEAGLEKLVGEYEGRADFGTLGTWVYDYVTEHPVTLGSLGDGGPTDLDIDHISGAVFAVHSQVIGLYRYLLGRADTPELRELVSQLLALEEHEAMRLAQQVNRLTDI